MLFYQKWGKQQQTQLIKDHLKSNWFETITSVTHNSNIYNLVTQLKSLGGIDQKTVYVAYALTCDQAFWIIFFFEERTPDRRLLMHQSFKIPFLLSLARNLYLMQVKVSDVGPCPSHPHIKREWWTSQPLYVSYMVFPFWIFPSFLWFWRIRNLYYIKLKCT